MKANVGTLDRTARIVFGLVLIALAATGTIGIWGYVGIVPLLTGLFRYCPAYGVLGVDTCGAPRR
ncbi:MAG: YgaP family membrane protein [Pseudomonadota bacterium]